MSTWDNREQANAYYDTLFAALRAEEGSAVDALARLGRQDLFFLLTRLLGRKDIDRDWLFARCREVQAEPNFMLDLWAREHYKALDVDTPVWTPEGWKRHGDLKPGDKVFAPSGELVTVLANTGAMTGADCFRVGGVVAAGDHRWPAQKKSRPRVPGGRAVAYRTVQIITREVGGFRLPLVSPLQGEEAALPLSPYVLGVWLGDGAKRGTRVTAGFADADELEGLLLLEGIQVSRSSHSNCVSLRIGNGVRGKRASSDFANALRALGVFESKHVPRPYLLASPRQRLGLLQGLMDTDGSVSARGTAVFVNTNEALVDAVAFLARSLGMRATKRAYNGFWQVAFQAYQGPVCPFRMERKRVRCKTGRPNMRTYRPVPVASRSVNCIQVEGGLYLAGEELLPTCNSTIITFGLTIQDILNEPETTIGLFSHTRPIAKAFLKQIMQEFERNQLLKDLYPDVLWQEPRKEAPSWSLDNGIIVKRRTNPKEATIEAWGLVDGQPTSKHFSRLVYDDVVTKESVSTPEQIQKTTDAWALSLNLGAHGGKRRYIGTRYHLFDTYKTMMDREAATPRLHPATEDGTVSGKPVFLTPELLAEKRREMGVHIFAAQMLQNPKADDVQGFNTTWLREWTPKARPGTNRYIVVDPAGSKNKDYDYTVMTVWELHEDQNYYLVDALRDRLSLTQRADALFRLHRKWRPLGVGYEKFGKDADIEHFQDRMNREEYRFGITAIYSQVPKNERIRKLVPLFEYGRIWTPNWLYFKDYEGKTQDFVKLFMEEYVNFPLSEHDDILDCMAQIVSPLLGAVLPQPLDAHAAPRKYDPLTYS